MKSRAALGKGTLKIALALVVLVLVGWGSIIYGPRLWYRYIHHDFDAHVVVAGLQVPWGFAFLPDGRLLVSERPGRLRLVSRDGQLGPAIKGVPEVLVAGEGGMLDVVADPQFGHNGRIYFSYAEPAPGPRQGDKHGGATVVARATLAGNALQDIVVLYRQERYELSGTHFGSRLLFGPDGFLYVGLGDRGVRESAQDLSVGMGKILRIDTDGGPAAGNPFIGREGALPQIWSYGHRNVQGLAFQPGSGLLWASEHGPQGGDEINLVKAGANYGWPVITHGCEYVSCEKIGEGTHKDGMEQPLKWFGPGSVPLTGMAFLSSDRYPQWRGQLVVGALWGRAMTRLSVQGGRVVDEAPIWLGRYAGVRDVKLGPDGWLYVAVSSPEGAILRLER